MSMKESNIVSIINFIQQTQHTVYIKKIIKNNMCTKSLMLKFNFIKIVLYLQSWFIVPGNQVFCVIKEIKAEDRASVVTLSAKKKKIDSASAHGVSYLDALTPGTKLSLCVTKILSNGLQVGFGKNVGYINQIYLDNSLSTYTENMELNGTLLYITPVTKLAYFSLLTDISEKEKLNVGDHVKEAKVLFRESNGIMLKFSKSGLRGFVSLRRTDVPFAKISTDFKPGSIHECRILSYNWSEHFYVCTMETRMLKEKYFSISDLSLGDILTVRITNVDRKSGFVRVQAGKIYGVATPEHVSDSGLRALKNLRNGDYVAARVLHTNDRRGIKFTLKPSLIKSELEILHDIHEARRGSVHHGTITMINKYGLLVKFYGDAKGWVPRALLNKDTANMNWNYAAGQTVKVSIESVQKDEGKMILKMADEAQKEQELVNMSIGELVEGTIVDSSVEGAHLRIHKGDGESAIVITGFLPAGHMSPCGEIGGLLASKYAPGDLISAYVFVTKPSVILSRTYVTQENYRRFEALKVGDCIPCTIMDVLPDGVRVALPIDGHSIFDFVSYKNISNFETLRANQIMFVKIAAIDTQRGQLSLTMALKDVWESSLECGNKMTPAVDVLSLYLNKLAELSTNPFYKDKPIAFATLGQKVNGHIEKITEHGLVLRLDNDLTGMVRKDHYSGEPKVGDKVFGTVLWKNYVHELVDVSLLPRIVNGISSKQKTLPQLPDSLVLKAEIVMITNWLILVLVKRNGTGYLAALPARRHVNDTSPDLTPYVLHAKVRVCIVLNRDDNVVPICVLKSTLEVSKEGAMAKTANKKSKRKASAVQDAKAKKLKTDDDDDEDEEMESEHDDDNRKRSWKEGEKRKDEGNRIKDIDEYSEVDSSSDEGSMEEDEVLSTAEEKSHVPECGFNWDEKWNSIVPPNAETSSDEDDDEEESVGQEPKQKKKKLSAAERREQERQKEREIRQREEALASNQMPNSVDQFDRLILSSPDSSLVWLQYMTYHVQATEIDKARAVARRALKTINFREENERLIMWNGWLNLESRFGTPESLNDVFQEALKVNDVQKVYSHMLTVHAEAGRHAELEKLIGTIIGKFKQDPQMWGDCGHVLYKVGLTDKSRHLMRRALQSLPNSKRKRYIPLNFKRSYISFAFYLTDN